MVHSSNESQFDAKSFWVSLAGAGCQEVNSLSTGFSGHKQRVELKMELMGPKPVPAWDASTAGGALVHVPRC